MIESPFERDTKCEILQAPVTGHTIKSKVKSIIGEGHAHLPYRVFRKQGDREIAVREQEEFNQDLKIVVRFENDPMITLNRCR